MNSRKLDLTFILSTSQSVSNTGYNQMRRFINRVVNGLTIGNQDTLVSVIEYNNDADTRFAFTANKNKASLIQAMNRLRRRGTASQNNLLRGRIHLSSGLLGLLIALNVEIMVHPLLSCHH